MFIRLSRFKDFSGEGATIREGTLIRRNTVVRKGDLVDYQAFFLTLSQTSPSFYMSVVYVF